MQRGLEGRRIALYCGEGAEGVNHIAAALEQAGAQVHRLSREDREEAWHGGMYAALVLVGGSTESVGANPRLVQLVREFMVSDKPVAALGVPLEAVQVDASLLAVHGDRDPDSFARQLVQELSTKLEEHALDEMSDQSFPASDPPATTPSTTGHVAPDQDRI